MTNKSMENNIKIRRQRYLVIELTVIVEEMLSKTLGNLLDIDWLVSKSLGYNSSALSFNQKVIIIQDIKGIDKITKEKLELLMYIRNKFAHIKEVNSFNSLFLISKNAIDIKKKLKKWYHKEDDKFEDIEEENVNYFIRLVSDAQDFLYNISKENAKKKGYEKGCETGRNEANERVIEKLMDEIQKMEGGNERIDNILNKIKNEFNIQE